MYQEVFRNDLGRLLAERAADRSSVELLCEVAVVSPDGSLHYVSPSILKDAPENLQQSLVYQWIASQVPSDLPTTRDGVVSPVASTVAKRLSDLFLSTQGSIPPSLIPKILAIVTPVVEFSLNKEALGKSVHKLTNLLTSASFDYGTPGYKEALRESLLIFMELLEKTKTISLGETSTQLLVEFRQNLDIMVEILEEAQEIA